MGADFLVAVTEVVKTEPDTVKKLVSGVLHALDEDTMRRLVESLENLCDVDSWLEEEEKVEGGFIEAVAEHASSCVKTLSSGSRDMTEIVLKGTEYWVSGGMSHGDSPTDVCEMIWFLDTLAYWVGGFEPSMQGCYS